MQHNKKHCPAVVGLYYYVDGISSPTEIAETLGLNTSTVWQILKRKYGIGSVRKQYDIDAIERDYLAGVSTYEMAEKYGVSHQTISKWMNKRGHIRGKGYVNNHCLAGSEKGRAVQLDRAIVKMKERAAEDSGGTVEFVSWGGDKSTFKCNVCGSVFEKWRGCTITCPHCHKEQMYASTEEREAEKEKRRLEREAEYAKEKHCASCGAVFHSEYKTKIYCSDTCARREKRHRNAALGKTKLHDCSNHRKRARLHGVPYEPGITIEKLMVRDNGICQICGQPCDVDDLRWGYSGPMYPSIDHIIAMANGGPHTWGNVQLAHAICNSFKRDLTDEEMAEEVRRHAEKQTA